MENDFYRLAAVGYHLPTGRVLIPGRSPTQMLAADLCEMAKSMAELGVSVPPEWKR